MTPPVDVEDARSSAVSSRAQRRVARWQLIDRCARELPQQPDELGLAATFESWGITDALAQKVYGCGDVFALADHVGQRLRLGTSPLIEPEHAAYVERQWLLRAATYTLPIVFMLIAFSDAAVPASSVAFAIVTCVGWGFSECVSRITYTTLNRGGPGALRRHGTLLAWVGPPTVTAIAVAVGLVSGSIGAGLLIGAQLLYLITAMVVLPVERERSLLIYTAPAVVLAIWNLSNSSLLRLALVLAIAGELVAMSQAVHHLRRFDRVPTAEPSRADLTEALPFLLSGLTMGGFVLACTATAIADLGSKRLALPLVLPLLISMGLAEIVIRRFQRQVDGHLATSIHLRHFALRARGAVAQYCAIYLVVLVALNAAAIALTALTLSEETAEAFLLVGLVGFSLFATLVLMVIDHIVPVVVGYSIAAVTIVAMLGIPDDLSAGTRMTFACGVAGGLAGALVAAALVTIAHPVRHGFD